MEHYRLEELQIACLFLWSNMSRRQDFYADLQRSEYVVLHKQSTDFHLSLKLYVNAHDVCDNVKDNGRRKRKRNENSDKKEKQRIPAANTRGNAGWRLSVRRRGSEPRMPRIASLLPRRTALSVELVYEYIKRGIDPSHTYNEQKAWATMRNWGPEEKNPRIYEGDTKILETRVKKDLSRSRSRFQFKKTASSDLDSDQILQTYREILVRYKE